MYLVSDCVTAREIWRRLQSFHEGTAHVKTRLYETYKREYENFSQVDGETVDTMFSRFTTIVNNMRANNADMPYDDHQRALKLLYVLDRRVWEVKVQAIIESANYETLTVDELFSKLKSTEIDLQTQARIKNPSAPTMALVLGNASSGSSLANPLPLSRALSSLVSATEEQMDSLGDDEQALVISRFSRFHNNRLNRRRGGNRQGCYGCGDPDHFVASCPKNKGDSGKYDYTKRKDKHESSSHKYKHKKNFNPERMKRKFFDQLEAKQRALVVSFSDIDSDGDSPLSDDESEKKVENKFNGLCFYSNSSRGGYCTMALDGTTTGNDDEVDTQSEVEPTIESLLAELDSVNDTMLKQDALLVRAAKERNDFNKKLAVALEELELARKDRVVVSDETDCDSCAIHMSSLATLQSKYAALVDKFDEDRAKPDMLNACAKCEALEMELGNCRLDKKHTEEENTFLRSMLSWLSCSEPQLGMMLSQYKRGTDTTGLGFATGGKGDNVFGKVGEHSGLSPSEKSTNAPKLIKITPPKPSEPTKPIVKDGVFEEPSKAPPQKQVWILKPNHLRNPLDTLPNISDKPLPKAPPRVNQIHKRVSHPPPKREVYHCDYCKRDGHLFEFCFRRKRDERRESEFYQQNVHRPSHGMHGSPTQRHTTRPRGARPQGARPQFVRPRDGRARRGPSRSQYESRSRGSGSQSYTSSGPRFPFRGDRSFPIGHEMYGVFPNSFPGQMTQHWFTPHFANPSVGSFAHPMSFY